MSIHDDTQVMLPAYALGALEPEEAVRAEAHLASCDRCTGELEGFRVVAGALTLVVPIAQPPRDLKARTMHRALTESASRRTAEPVPSSSPWRRRSWFAPAFAGLAVFVAIATLGLTAWQTAQLSRQVQVQKDLMTVVAYAQGAAQVVRGTAKAPDAVGRLYLDPDSSVAALVTVDLPPLAGDRAYQVWLTEADGTKVSGGLFQLDAEGNGWILVHAQRHLNAYVQVGVTDEPTGGSDNPTTMPVLLAKLASP
jgi:anti-sigma-K factor RskA